MKKEDTTFTEEEMVELLDVLARPGDFQPGLFQEIFTFETMRRLALTAMVFQHATHKYTQHLPSCATRNNLVEGYTDAHGHMACDCELFAYKRRDNRTFLRDTSYGMIGLRGL